MDTPKLPAIGTKLGGRYRLVFGRGEGPSGFVFKALDLALDLPVAVKVFRPELFTSTFREQNLFRLYRARTFQDPSLLKIQEVQEDAGVHFLTCSLVEGMSLRQVIDLHDESGEAFPLTKIRSFAERMIESVQAIHRAGAIHGNLKPENFFVLPERLVASDPFHLVIKALAEGDQIPVSDYYRGPEQLTDPVVELPQTDVYALALILGEILAISPVKPGVPLSAQVPRLTRRLDDLFLVATAEDPANRFDTVEQFAEAFREAVAVVETEGLWVRRGHETGSFRALKLTRGPGEESGLTPIPTYLGPTTPAPEPAYEAAPAAVAYAPPPAPVAAPEPPPPPPEALEEEVTFEAVQEVVEAAPEAVLDEAPAVEPPMDEADIFVETESAPPPTSVVPPTWDDDKTIIAPMAFQMDGSKVEIVPVEEEPLILEEEEIEGIEVAPSGGEENIEGIEVLGEEMPPLPGTPVDEPPPMPAEAAGDGTLEMESLVEEPVSAMPVMAPFERLQGQQQLSKRAAKKAARNGKVPVREPSRVEALPEPPPPAPPPVVTAPPPPPPAPPPPPVARKVEPAKAPVCRSYPGSGSDAGQLGSGPEGPPERSWPKAMSARRPRARIA